MSDYYEITGTLTFRSAQEARDAVATLRAVHDDVATLFWGPPRDPDGPPEKDLVVKGSALRVSWKGFASGGETYFATRSRLQELARIAVSGRVGLREGEDGQLEYVGNIPSAKPAAKMKAAASKKALPTIDCSEPLLVLARGYARIWGGEKNEKRFAKLKDLREPVKVDMGNVDAVALPPGPPTAFLRAEDGGMLLRAETGDNALLADAARALPAKAWKPIPCRMTGGSHGAILVFKASNPGVRPNGGVKGLRIPVARSEWPHIMYDVSVAEISETIDGKRVAGSVTRLARKR
jgi:hypothetical protein